MAEVDWVYRVEGPLEEFVLCARCRKTFTPVSVEQRYCKRTCKREATRVRKKMNEAYGIPRERVDIVSRVNVMAMAAREGRHEGYRQIMEQRPRTYRGA